MLSALSASSSAVQLLSASSAVAASTSNRTAPDSASISSAGQQLSKASMDMDNDGDSH